MRFHSLWWHFGFFRLVAVNLKKTTDLQNLPLDLQLNPIDISTYSYPLHVIPTSYNTNAIHGISQSLEIFRFL